MGHPVENVLEGIGKSAWKSWVNMYIQESYFKVDNGRHRVNEISMEEKYGVEKR